ncbi:hypothetical protein XELAEV_18009723mg [Xenopus laevis]|uniref:Uncharacterized protein n=1 Tax=Xenopus laevis TaxID=8355 RepID=A0A974DUJ7_XENLA|nr:hypothetical protein XELAEV_18009723mg [Xenopus laevis]
MPSTLFYREQICSAHNLSPAAGIIYGFVWFCLMQLGISWKKMTTHALEKVLVDAEGIPGFDPGSSSHRFMHRRRAFMKKLLTVLSSRPSC